MSVQGIYDVELRILTFENGQAFKVKDGSIDALETEQRLTKLTHWARENSLIRQSSVIAEI